MGPAKILQSLRLYNQKAEKLAFTRFGQTVLFEDTGYTISARKGEPVVVQRRGPDQEAIEVFVLTFRFFVNRSELCSLANLEKAYGYAPVSEELKSGFRRLLRELDTYLDSPSEFAQEGGTRLTQRTILEAFLWGGLAHANPRHKRLYDQWMSYGSLSEIHWNRLIVILGNCLKIIVAIHDLNARVIRAMGEVP